MPTGSCLCGKLKYECGVDRGQTMLCHCLQCRKLSSSLFGTMVLVPDSSFKIISGTPKHYTFTQESGLQFTTSFCGDCSVTIGKRQAEGTGNEFKGMMIVFVSTLDDVTNMGEFLKPQGEIWTKHRMPWLQPMEGAGQSEMFPAA